MICFKCLPIEVQVIVIAKLIGISLAVYVIGIILFLIIGYFYMRYFYDGEPTVVNYPK